MRGITFLIFEKILWSKFKRCDFFKTKKNQKKLYIIPSIHINKMSFEIEDVDLRSDIEYDEEFP